MKTNKFYTIATFSVSKNSKYKEVIATIQYRNNVLDNIKWDDLYRYNQIFRANKTLEIFHIIKDPLKEILEPSNTSLFQNINIKNEKLETIDFNEIPDHIFFTIKFTDELFFNFNSDLSTKIFFFEYTQWKILVRKFHDLGITLSGGSTTKRHLLSPVHMRLSSFLFIIEGYQESLDNTITSYQLNNLVHSFNVIENFSKNNDIWKLRNLIKKLDKYNEDEIDIRLFLLNKINPYYIKNLTEDIKKNQTTIFY
jgi:hypothetical protein